MEVSAGVDAKTGPRRRPLTPARALQGVVCLLVLVLSAIMILVYCGFWIAIVLRLFSIRCSRRMSSFLFGIWLALWPFLFEKINKTRVVFTGDSVPPRERVLVIANHRTEVDWMYLWDLAIRKGTIGYVKYVLKSSLMKLPLFGWVFHIMEFIPLERNWEADEPVIHQMVSNFKDPRDPLWLVVFPEGTDFTEKKCQDSQKYASEHSLPVMKNVLLPKSKGFYACLEDLRGSLDAVYDITIGYKHRCPTVFDNAFGIDPSEVHVHVRRLPVDDIPKSESQVASWLMDTFSLKDQLLSGFSSQGYISGDRIEEDLSTTKCLLIFFFVLILTSVCTYLTFCSSVWFKIYFFSVCACFTSATYLKILPSQIF